MATSPTQKNLSPIWRELTLFVCFAAFGVYSAAALVKPQAASAPAAPKTTFSRAPSAAIPVAVPEKSTQVIFMGCLGSGTSPLRTQANLARLMADECRPASSVQARNKTTGESLMIFQRGKKISTHYFPLKEGENTIVVEWLGPKGERSVETLRVNRKPAP